MTRKFLFSILYAALALGANPVFAETIDLSAISELREGDMKKLVLHSEPRDLTVKTFLDVDNLCDLVFLTVFCLALLRTT